MITRTPENKCLNCGCKIDSAGSPDHDQAVPSEGCLSVCLRCGAVMAYADDLTLRGFTDAEMNEIQSDPETMNDLAMMVQRVHLVRAIRN